jgi:hypothetical protein
MAPYLMKVAGPFIFVGRGDVVCVKGTLASVSIAKKKS